MKKCFVICPIGEEESDTRKHSDKVYNFLIKPVCKENGYDAKRSTDYDTIEKIDDKMFNHLDNDELAIADLTELNPNVFYEAGYRYAKNLNIIHIAEKGTKLPFDIKDFNIIFYSFDVADVQKFKEKISAILKSLEENTVVDDRTIIENKNEKKNDHVVYSDDLTKDAKILLKKLYKLYVERKSEGMRMSEAERFQSSKDISPILGMKFEDVDDLMRVLDRTGYLACIYADDMVYKSALTDKAKKYCEDIFEEPTYIGLLRFIISEYSSRNATVSWDKFKDYSDGDFAILESQGFIEKNKYLNGHFSVRPTSLGVAKITALDNFYEA